MEDKNKEIILIADPRILAIEIQENYDPLIDLSDQNIIAYGPSPEIPNNTDYTKMRKKVYDKLVAAQTTLPQGIKFCVYECYRSFELQEKLFSDRYNKLKEIHPSWTHQQVFKETTKLVSPLINLDESKNIAPHSTGGAVDLYLIDDQNQRLDMGMYLEDTWEDLDGSLSKTDSDRISVEAKENRNLMGRILTEAGFVNYPTEFWHWSYGDKYWAYHKNQPFAFYNSI